MVRVRSPVRFRRWAPNSNEVAALWLLSERQGPGNRIGDLPPKLGGGSRSEPGVWKPGACSGVWTRGGGTPVRFRRWAPNSNEVAALWSLSERQGPGKRIGGLVRRNRLPQRNALSALWVGAIGPAEIISKQGAFIRRATGYNPRPFAGRVLGQ